MVLSAESGRRVRKHKKYYKVDTLAEQVDTYNNVDRFENRSYAKPLFAFALTACISKLNKSAC
jgi:hypothetical protein